MSDEPTPLQQFAGELGTVIRSYQDELEPDDIELVLEQEAQVQRSLWADQTDLEVPR
jgi:hypothetical protein|uniref:Uncharacterized protein n=1 Tax=uncultured virus TaxID=340016 RepID=D5L2M2_9VIRU|nr:hypothetical protein [uncultured virus]